MVKALFENLLCLSYVSPMSVLLWFRISFKVILVQLVYRKILAICAFTSFMHLFGIASYDATDIFIFIFYFSWSTSYEDLLSTNEPFAERIPLPEMVDFLVDIWLDEEGTFD